LSVGQQQQQLTAKDDYDTNPEPTNARHGLLKHRPQAPNAATATLPTPGWLAY